MRTGRKVWKAVKRKAGVLCSPNPGGLCMCGCGDPTEIASQTRSARGWVRGEPKRYVSGHGNKRSGLPFGEVEHQGYRMVRDPGHPRAHSNGYVHQHIIVAERALGRPMPDGAVVHHVNGVKDDNRPENLVVCEDNSYHSLLHLRQSAMDACGNPDYRWCWWCKTYDDPAALRDIPSGGWIHHECERESERERYARRVA